MSAAAPSMTLNAPRAAAAWGARAPARLAPGAILGAWFVLLAWRLWGAWPDPLVDFGRELYVPWRLVEGDVLYRDLAYFNGPLSPTVNAAWFALGGVSLRTLVLANHAILLVATWLMYGLVRQLASRGAATVACVGFLAFSGFSQFTHTRNYNFICPYSHEMTHGLVLTLAALAVAWRARTVRGATGAGLLLGLALLTKVEIAVAATVGVLASVALVAWAEHRTANAAAVRAIAWRLAGVALAACAPVVVAVAWFAPRLGWQGAVGSCFGGWLMAANPDVTGLAFYRDGMGTLHLGESLLDLAASLARWWVFLGAAALLMHLARSHRVPHRRAAAAALGAFAGLGLLGGGFNWPLMERSLPVGMAALAGWQVDALRRARRPGEAALAARRAAWCLFALALLAKLGLNSRVGNYGFVLAAPALATAVVSVFDWLVGAANRRGWPGELLPWLAAPLFASYALAYQSEQARLDDRSTILGGSRDQFAAPIEARPVREAELQLARRAAPDETLAVLPEGVMLNYLVRRRAPTRYTTWMPPELLHFGESTMSAAMAASPPDWVLLAPRSLREYGAAPFGSGYADALAKWVEAHYAEVARWPGATVGAADGAGPWRLLRRRTPAHDAGAQAAAR